MSTEAKLRAPHERDDYPDPTEDDLKDPAFNAVWEAIKGWDLSRESMTHRMYSGATGNDVMHILTALRAVEQACAVPTPDPIAMYRDVISAAAAAVRLACGVDEANEGEADQLRKAAIACRDLGRKLLEATQAAEAGKAQAEGWVSVEERPLEPGDTRLMAVEILRNGVPDWDVFVGTVSEEYEDEWSSESDDPGWAPSEVGYSLSISGLPKLKPPTSGGPNAE